MSQTIEQNLSPPMPVVGLMGAGPRIAGPRIAPQAIAGHAIARGALITLLLLCLGCVPPRAERSDYSAVQLSELRQEQSEWVLKLQLNNFAFEDPIDLEQLEVRVVLNGKLLVDRVQPMQLYLPALGIEVWQLRVPVRDDFPVSEQMHYEISGSVRTRQYGRSFDYQHEGTLSAVPGVQRAWR